MLSTLLLLLFLIRFSIHYKFSLNCVLYFVCKMKSNIGANAMLFMYVLYENNNKMYFYQILHYTTNKMECIKRLLFNLHPKPLLSKVILITFEHSSIYRRSKFKVFIVFPYLNIIWTN